MGATLLTPELFHTRRKPLLASPVIGKNALPVRTVAPTVDPTLANGAPFKESPVFIFPWFFTYATWPYSSVRFESGVVDACRSHERVIGRVITIARVPSACVGVQRGRQCLVEATTEHAIVKRARPLVVDEQSLGRQIPDRVAGTDRSPRKLDCARHG